MIRKLNYPAAHSFTPIAQAVEICLANGLSRFTERIKVVEGAVADVDTGTGLRGSRGD